MQIPMVFLFRRQNCLCDDMFDIVVNEVSCIMYVVINIL